MGFIEFNKRTGRVVLANARPVPGLEPKHLQLGTTSKDKKSELAGSHGEGFKVAAMVMSRAGYKVRIEASNYNWSFHFGGQSRTQFKCTLNPSKKKTPSSSGFRQHMKPIPGFKSRIWADVAVMIGPGCGHSACKVTRAEFVRWLGIAFDIQGFSAPSNTVRTVAGDLILDPSFANKIYLKGLLLPTTSSDEEKFHYGYNFHNGRVNRDREQLRSSGEEAELLADLWQKGIEQGQGDVLHKYVTMLRHSQPCSDVAQADRLVEYETAKKIWDHLLLEAGEEKFYHEDKQNIVRARVYALLSAVF